MLRRIDFIQIAAHDHIVSAVVHILFIHEHVICNHRQIQRQHRHHKEGQDAGKAAQKKQKQKKQSGRDAVITAERTDYDRKEGVILFDRNVYVDDEQYQLHADRLFLFMDGTNLKRLVALGNVAITNEEKNASCSRAVYVKKLSKIVMYGSDAAPARLYQGGKKASTVVGERITFWLNSEQVEIEKPVVTVPGGSFKGGDGKDFLKNLKQ